MITNKKGLFMIRKGLCLIVGVLIIVFSVVHAGDGENGQLFPFLRYGVGVQALGMGKAYTSIADGPSGFLWNPAGSARPSVQNWQVAFGYDQLFFDESKLNYFSGLYPHRKWGTFGLAFVSFSNDGFEGRDIYNQPTGDFSVKQGLLGLSYGKYWGNYYFIKNLAMGLFIKSLSNKVADDNYSAMDMDFGLKWKISYLKKAGFGFAYQNLLKSKVNEDEMVSAMILGMNYLVMKDVTALFDVYLPSAGESDIRLGVEYKNTMISKDYPIYLRAGFSKNEIALGASIRFYLPSSYSTQIDYAYTNQSEIEYSSSKFGLSLFGASEPCDQKIFFILGDTSAVYTASYNQFMKERVERKEDDLEAITTDCAGGIYGAMASVLLGNYYFYQEDYENAKIRYGEGYQSIFDLGGYEKAFGMETEEDLQNARMVIRYETHSNYALSFLYLKQYEQGVNVLTALTKMETYQNPNQTDKPVENFKYAFFYNYALLNYGAEIYDQTVINLNQVISADIQSIKPDLLYMAALLQGKAYYQLKDYEKAKQSLSRIPDLSGDFNGMISGVTNSEPNQLKDSFIIDDKLILLALISQEQNDNEKKIEYCKDIILNYSFSDNYEKAIELLSHDKGE